MVAALFEATDAADLRARMQSHARFADQVAGWDLRAVEVARALAVKWGVPS